MAKAAKTKVVEINAPEKASDVAKKIWLAGLGAYGKAFDEAAGHIDKMKGDGTKMFDDLVAKGRKLDVQGHEKLSTAKNKTSMSIEERISKVRDTLGFVRGGNPQIEQLSASIDELNAKLDALLDANNVSVKKTRRSASSAEG